MTKNRSKRPQSGASYTAADVRQAAGLSYRQLNDWEGKGVMPDPRSEDASWRKYSPRDIFALMVCKEIRDRFGVPLESLRWLKDFMFQQDADHFAAAVEMMAMGMSVLLLTDLSKTFVMDSDLEMEDLLKLGYFRHEEGQGYILLKLNPLVNRLLSCLKEPFQLRIHDRFYAVVRDTLGAMRVRSVEEFEVLELVRKGEFRRVSVLLKGGRVERIEAEKEHDIRERGEILDLLNSSKYQTVTLTKVDGQIIRVTRKIPIKFGTPPARQRTPERGRGEK